MRKNTIRKKCCKCCGALLGILLCFAVSACGVQQETAESDTEQTKTEDGAQAQELSAPGSADGGSESSGEGNADGASDGSQKENTDGVSDTDGKNASQTNQTQREEITDKMAGKTLSILGDSLSTYEGWIPGGYVDYFPRNGELTDVSQTWWDILLKHTGLELCVNGSSAASTCVGDSLSTDDPKYGCSDYRISDLCGGGVWPDIIIVYMGTNDLLTSVPMGENDGTDIVEEGVIENFSDAYCLMLDKLQAQYPGSQIFCCTLPQIGTWGDNQPFVVFENRLGMTAEDYNRQIKIIAEAKDCTVIDLEECGITIGNMHQYITDGVHFKPEGMELIEEVIEEALEEGVR
ncbi:MAG: GDSL-type esterase/lipase family protein [Blautia sp.]|nr:GDSL-type esterase/lipase family protein [Lachnoclostridium sp.]MCM1211005.1 GDSL-type esterase/lipase family protein [Blautia sp.]